MESNEQRPNAALINREWFASAAGILSRQELGLVLVQCVEYVFGISSEWELRDRAEIVFAMVRPSLDSDIAKYRERCARNAANARSRSERVAASGSEWERVGANTTTTTTTTPTTTTTQSLSPAEKEKEERFMVYGYFWSLGQYGSKEESAAFWAYYESLGWRNNKGAAIVSKLAAARMWRRQYVNGEPRAFAAQWFNAFKSAAVRDYNIWNAYAGAEILPDPAPVVVVRLHAPQSFLTDIESKLGECLQAFRKACSADSVRLESVP